MRSNRFFSSIEIPCTYERASLIRISMNMERSLVHNIFIFFFKQNSVIQQALLFYFLKINSFWGKCFTFPTVVLKRFFFLKISVNRKNFRLTECLLLNQQKFLLKVYQQIILLSRQNVFLIAVCFVCFNEEFRFLHYCIDSWLSATSWIFRHVKINRFEEILHSFLT